MASSKNSYGWTTPDAQSQTSQMQNMQSSANADYMMNAQQSAAQGYEDTGGAWGSQQSSGGAWQTGASANDMMSEASVMNRFDQAAASGMVPQGMTRDQYLKDYQSYMQQAGDSRWGRPQSDYRDLSNQGIQAQSGGTSNQMAVTNRSMSTGQPDYGSANVQTNFYSGNPRSGESYNIYPYYGQQQGQVSGATSGAQVQGLFDGTNGSALNLGSLEGGNNGTQQGGTGSSGDLAWGWSQLAQPTMGLDYGKIYDQLPPRYNADTDKDYRGNVNSWGENWYWPAMEFNRADRNDLLNYGISLGNLNEQTRANMAREGIEGGQLDLATGQWYGEGGAIDQYYAGLDVTKEGQNQNYALGLAGLEESGRVANMTNQTTRDLGFGQLDLQKIEGDRNYELNQMGMDQAERKLAGDLSEQLHRMGIDDRGMTLAEMQSARDDAFRYKELEQQGGLAGRGLDIEQQLANQGNEQFYAGLTEQGRQFDTSAGFENRRVGIEENMSAAQIADMLHAQGISTRGMDLAELTQAQDYALGNRGLDIEGQRVSNDFTLGNRGLDIESQLGNRGLDVESQLGNRGLDVQSQKNAWDYALGNRGMDIQQQLADITAGKSQAEIRQIDANIGNMLFQQGIDSRRMTMEEKLSASTIADRLAKQGIDTRGMDLAELQRQDAMQEQQFRQGFDVRQMLLSAQLQRESLQSQERQAAMAAFGRDQGPNAQFLRNW